MKLLEVRQEADFERLRDDWERLVSRSASQSIFVTWEWMNSWWSAYGTAGDLRILAAFDHAGDLRGIAPLRRQKVRRYGQTVEALSFVGDGSIESEFNDSDYLDFIVAQGYEKAVMEAFQAHWNATSDGGTVLLLNEMPESSPNLAELKELAQRRGMHWAETSVPCASVRMPGTWEEYLQKLQPRFRTKIRSVLRNLESRPEVRFGFCEDAGRLERLLPALFDLHTRRWTREGKPGVFGGGDKRDFYQRLSRVLLDRRWLRFSYLEWQGQVLACQYGFEYQNTYSQLQEGYEPASEHLNVGVALRAWSIRELLKAGLREYDFLGGVNRHKTDWGGEVKYSKRVLLADGGYRNLLLRHAPALTAAAREHIRALLPAKLLETRRVLLQGRRAGERIWARNAAAGLYFHTGMGRLTRPLRDRFEVTTGNGKLSLKKRTRGRARILYYHSVSDEQNPFSEAISTALFEEHARYLSRNYKVVPLKDLVRHLEDNSPELLLAITFDDGYADNYWNAFPILRRYGLPATIFLTTGALDSGEPLWFERLAEAVRTSSREYIDLETDIPRRFRLQTLPERVETNRRIFSMLRNLKDVDRIELLARILRELGSGTAEARKNRMLSWDQVREMNAGAIDFGGHTVTHPFLSKMTPAEALWEVSECKRRIEHEIQQPADYFAYPNGREEDFSAENKQTLRAAGYRAAVTTIWGMNDESTDPMELKRGGPWENSAALFASKLDWYQMSNQ